MKDRRDISTLSGIVIKPLKMFTSDRISLLILVGKYGGKEVNFRAARRRIRR